MATFNMKKAIKTKAKEEEWGETLDGPPTGSFNMKDTLITKTRPVRGAHPWSVQQQAIFKACAESASSLVIEALAGTGKTTTIIEATRHLKGKILLCAFNKRIADELKSRTEAMDLGDAVHVSTLHGLGFRLIQRLQPGTDVDNMRGLGTALEALRAVDGPISKNYQWIVKDTMSICKETAPYLKASDGKIVGEIGYAFGHFDRLDPRFLEITCDAVLEAMRRSLEPTGFVDFSDMLYIPLHRIASRGEYDVVVVDEAQDMNRAQLALAQQVLKENGRLIVVGDRHQAIYGFRGADKGSMDRLREAFKAEVLPLSVTYRCPTSVVACAQAFVPALEAAPSAPAGEVAYKGYAQMIKDAGPGNFILSRLNAPLLRLCLTFIKEGRSAIVEGKDIGKGLITLIKKLTYGNQSYDLNLFLDGLRVWELKSCKKAEDNDDKDRVSQVSDQAEALRILSEGCSNISSLMFHIDRMFEDTNGKANKIILSTVHKAKGLESDRVFILCDTFKGGWQGGEGEEANLKYVAITRSKGSLIFIEHPEPPKPKGKTNANEGKEAAGAREGSKPQDPSLSAGVPPVKALGAGKGGTHEG